MALIALALYGVPARETKPAAASAPAIARRLRRSPVLGLRRRRRLASATASGTVSTWLLRPSHLPLVARTRSQPCRSRSTSLAFSYWAKAPAICRNITLAGSELSVRSWPEAVTTRMPRDASSITPSSWAMTERAKRLASSTRIVVRPSRAAACCTDGRDGVGRGLFLPFGCRRHAAQSQCCSPPPYSTAEATGDQLVGV